MHLSIILKILGILLMLFSLSNLPPIVVSFIYSDGNAAAFSTAFMITFALGLCLWIPTIKSKEDLSIRDSFLVVTLFWGVLGTIGCLPFLLSDAIELSFTDAVFESMSGLTTTGATVLSNIDSLPKSILFYRQQLQWLGGMGLIVLAVAILPMLGIGGMQLYRAESPGPVKDHKLVPKLAETAKALWIIYTSLTLVCALCYWIFGMDLFDAISHSFTTVAIGGFSTHDASLGYFDSTLIDSVAIVFMFLAGINFALHFTAWRRKSIRHYLKDPELKFYSLVLVSASLLAITVLALTGTYDLSESLINGLFHVVSIATTTGFATESFSAWPLGLPFVLMFTAIIGSCAGSTGGGMKAIRILLIFKQGFREIERLIHPSAVIPIKLGKEPVRDRIIDSVWGFFSVYVMAFLLLMLLLLATGLDAVTAFSAVAACINNMGPGLAGVAENYGNISGTAKWILCMAMLLGRLEIFTLLVLFTPMFWRR